MNCTGGDTRRRVHRERRREVRARGASEETAFSRERRRWRAIVDARRATKIWLAHHAVRSGRFSDARRHGDVVVDSEHAANGVRGVRVRARLVASRRVASRSFVRCAGARGKTGMRDGGGRRRGGGAGMKETKATDERDRWFERRVGMDFNA